MVSFDSFLNSVYLNNTGQDYLVSLITFVALFILLKVFDSSILSFLKRQAKKTKFAWDDLIVDFVSAIHWQFYAYISFYVAVRRLEMSDVIQSTLNFLLMLFILFYAAQGVTRIINGLTNAQIEKRKKEDNAQNTSMIKVFGSIFKGIIWIIAALMLLDNIGIEITPLVASLGIGGVAIAIALQSVLADLFSAFAIYFDKPFKEGDFIIIGDDMGTVKHIGIKTTRIQSLSGQELVVSNSELTSTRVNNYKKMERRRIAFQIGVEYSTPSKKLKKINSIVEKVVKNVDKATLDRVHFKSFGDFSLNYEIVYYVETPDYAKFMDIQEAINLALFEEFEKEKISFAFPTQTLHIEKN